MFTKKTDPNVLRIDSAMTILNFKFQFIYIFLCSIRCTKIVLTCSAFKIGPFLFCRSCPPGSTCTYVDFLFLVAKQLYTWPCLCVCVFSVFDMKYLYLFEYQEYSRIFKERERFNTKSWERTDNKQTHRCKKLKLRPTPTKVSYQLTKMTGRWDSCR